MEVLPRFYLFEALSTQHRRRPCCLCGEKQGSLVGRANYFGLARLAMVQCPVCGLISADDMPDSKTVEEGCSRLYAHQLQFESRGSIERGFAKSYRRGARFARKYLRGRWKTDQPKILEIGPGDGYFSAGIRSVFPGARLTFVDIVQDLMGYYRAHHECDAVHGELETAELPERSFDLVVFRDLLEHVRDPRRFLSEVARILRPGGLAFFITPNGREDFWTISQRSRRGGEALLLLNHFHYFLPETLIRLLRSEALTPVESFKFGLKQHRKGLGWRDQADFPEEHVPDPIGGAPGPQIRWRHDGSLVSRGLLSNGGVVSRVYGWCVDRERSRVPFDSPIGHEFFVIARKGPE